MNQKRQRLDAATAMEGRLVTSFAHGRRPSARALLATAGLALFIAPALAQPKPGEAAAPTPPPAGDAAFPDTDTGNPETITLAAFAEPMALPALVELVAQALQVNMTIKGELTGQIVFNAPVEVRKDRLLALLDALLSQHNFTVTFDDDAQFYVVHPVTEVEVGRGGDRATTRVIPTPNIRPSAIKAALDQQFIPLPGAQTQRQISAVDDLGVLVATDTPRRLDAMERLVTQLLDQYGKAKFIRFELDHVAAPVARERALQLVGQLTQPLSGGTTPEGQPQPAQIAAGSPSRVTNLGDRLTVDPQGNALIFRGVEAEIEQVREILNVIDLPNTLVPREYFAGSAAAQIADIARQRGLGEVTTIMGAFTDPYGGVWDPRFMQQQQQGTQPRQTTSGGPVMVVDEVRGKIVYYGTPAQHAQLDALIRELDTGAELVVIREYKLRHSRAVDVAEIINALITGTQPAADSPLLPDGSPAPGGGNPAQRQPSRQRSYAGAQGAEGEELTLDQNAFVIADEGNNQIIVKAALGQQDDFERLIRKLDLRRPQVYVEARIVAVTADDRLRLAFETQLINASGTGGVLNTNFGLGSFASGQPINTPKLVPGGLSGLTAAIIKSDQVPIIMNALANETDSRIVSTPQLLVDDNEEAEVVSVDTQPVATISRGTGGQGDIITSDREVEAGTRLTVTPQISEGGYLRLKYEIELSSFTGEARENLPPPTQRNTLKAESITVPSDSTVVVGGLVVDADTNTVVKVPLLGDIPLLGLLFSDTRTGDRSTRIYVFLTPRILREPNFADLRLLTRGPSRAAGVPGEIPDMRPTRIDVIAPSAPANRSLPPPAPAPAPGSATDVVPPAAQPGPEGEVD